MGGDPSEKKSSDGRKLVRGVVDAIDAAWEVEEREDRAYIGASGIGAKCLAELEFGLRGFPAKQPEPKLARIFRDGHRIEAQVVRDLRKAGYFVLEKDEMTGRQWHYEMAGGHVKTNTDGMIALDKSKPDRLSLLEVKSMNDELWNKFKDHGVKVSHPKYYDQMQMMMGMSGLTDCLFIAYNKNTSLYHTEYVEFDDFDWAYLKTKIVEVFEGKARKITDNPDSFLCRFCFRKEVCWDGKKPETKCSTCVMSKPMSDGTWWCRKNNDTAKAVCPNWEPWAPKEK